MGSWGRRREQEKEHWRWWWRQVGTHGASAKPLCGLFLAFSVVVVGCSATPDADDVVVLELEQPNEVELDEGEARLFWRAPVGEVGAHRDQLTIDVVGPSGDPIEMRPGSETIAPSGDSNYIALGSFDAPDDGAYVVTVVLEVPIDAITRAAVAGEPVLEP